MSQAGHLTWLVKIPKFLSERWLQQAQLGGTGAELGTMRVYEELSWRNYFRRIFSGTQGYQIQYSHPPFIIRSVMAKAAHEKLNLF